MNGGVDHCVEALPEEEMLSAIQGFRYLGANDIADVLERARGLDVDDPANESKIEALNTDYGRASPTDQVIVDLFETKFREAPEDFADVR